MDARQTKKYQLIFSYSIARIKPSFTETGGSHPNKIRAFDIYLQITINAASHPLPSSKTPSKAHVGTGNKRDGIPANRAHSPLAR